MRLFNSFSLVNLFKNILKTNTTDAPLEVCAEIIFIL